jgi:hypothetical protein
MYPQGKLPVNHAEEIFARIAPLRRIQDISFIRVTGVIRGQIGSG